MIEVTHQRKSRIDARYVSCRASHVDVDDVRATRLRNACTFSHPVRFRSLRAGQHEGRPPDASQRRTDIARPRARSLLGGHFGNNQASAQFSS